MINWKEVLRRADGHNLSPDHRVERTPEEWKKLLSAESYYVTRESGTERPHSSEMCSYFEPGFYSCICCKTPLFDASQKFESGTGWPSFTQPLRNNVIDYHSDHSLARKRIEVTCSVCDAHLGHVFPDGPDPPGLRYCINAVALEKMESIEELVIGGGCFWCTEAVFKDLHGVVQVKCGYAGGSSEHANYKAVCTGQTDHAEVVRISFDPNIISKKAILEIHLSTHDPTTLNRQGADKGPQYRSVVFYTSEESKKQAQEVIQSMEDAWDDPMVTTLEPLVEFYPAEAYHHNYYENNPSKGYCSVVIAPKLAKFREKYGHLMR